MLSRSLLLSAAALALSLAPTAPAGRAETAIISGLLDPIHASAQ